MMELNTSNIIMLVLITLIIGGTSYLYLELKKLKSVVSNNTQNIKSLNNALVNIINSKKPTTTAPRNINKSMPPPINKTVNIKVDPQINKIMPKTPRPMPVITRHPNPPESHQYLNQKIKNYIVIN